MRKGWWLAILVVAAGGAGVFLARRPKPAPANTYVDPKLCAGCHAKIAATYRLTGMGRSFYRPRPENTVEDYSKNNRLYHAASDTHFEMLRRDGRFYQRRWQTGYGGRETNVEETAIDFVMGSGNHARSYLRRAARGALIELPVAWYAEKGGYWAMSPGFDNAHPDSRRKIGDDCLACHNAYPREGYAEGIDCQRCHGPGAAHLQAVSRGGDARGSIVNPARLSAERRIEVCMQCHLETTSDALPSAIRRFERNPFSYRPGEPLGEFMFFFDHAPGSGRKNKFEIVSSVYRLRQSACFLRSGGKLTCTTCHDPHSIPRGEEAARRYDQVCRQCHPAVPAASHAAPDDCARCHMPKRRTEDVVHAVMTDHLIQRRKPERDLLAGIPERSQAAYRGEVVPYYPTAVDPLYLAAAQVLQKSNLAGGLDRFAAAIERARPTRPEFYIILGDAWKDAGQPQKAIAAYREAVRLDPKSALALRNLGAVSKDVEILKRAAQADPDDATTWYELGLTDSGAAHFEKAIALDPDMAESYNSLGANLAEAGATDRAETAFRDAIRIRPYFAEAHANLAKLLSLKSQLSEAAYHFERSIHLQPNNAATRYDYGVALLRQERFAEAQQQIEAAVKNDPTLPEAHDLLGVLLERKGQMTAALREYREAVRLRPGFSKARLDLGTALAAAGDKPGAIEHLREAVKSSDPEIKQDAEQALRQIGAR